MYLRTVKVPSSSGKINEYVRIVEAYREDGKVKQRVIADLGRKDVLAGLLPKLQRLLAGDNAIVGQESPADGESPGGRHLGADARGTQPGATTGLAGDVPAAAQERSY